MKFHIGDKVYIDPKKVSQKALDGSGSDGVFNKIYTITEYSSNQGSYNDYVLAGSNWHKEVWLILVNEEVLKGGYIDEFNGQTDSSRKGS